MFYYLNYEFILESGDDWIISFPVPSEDIYYKITEEVKNTNSDDECIAILDSYEEQFKHFNVNYTKHGYEGCWNYDNK